MSKAFVKEQEEPESDDLEQETAVPGGKNYITAPGFTRLKEELKELLTVQRPEVVRIVSWAASNGDRSENGDYIYGKRRLREIDKRIRFLTKRIEIAEVVDPHGQKANIVSFGATVTIEDESGNKKRISIVGMDETDVSKGRISWISPLGKALLQAKKGDVVTVRLPKGPEDFEILEIKYETLE